MTAIHTAARGGTHHVVRLSRTQERIWLASELSDDVPAYRIVDRFTIHAEVSASTILEAFTLVAEHHGPLRTSFRIERAQLMQVVQSAAGAAPVHAIPTDYPRPAKRSFAGVDTAALIPATLISRLSPVADEIGATPFELCLAIFALLVRHLSGHDDIVLGLPATGRNRTELRPLIGVFVNIMVLRVDSVGDPGFAQFTERVRQALRAAVEHQELPFQHFATASGARRISRVPPIYQIVLTISPFPPFEMSTTATEDDLMMEVSGDKVRLEYDT